MATPETPKAAPAPAAAAPQQPPANSAAPAAAAKPGAPATAAAPAAAPTKAAVAAEAMNAAKAQAKERAKKALSGFRKLGLWNLLYSVTENLTSQDRPSRKMARYFVISVVGIVVTLLISTKYFSDVRNQLAHEFSDTGEQGKNLGDFIKRQADEAKRKFSTQSLGSFTLELKPPVGAEGKELHRPIGVMNLADIEIIVECDEKETCEFIEDRMPEVRNELTSLFTAMERDELLSKEGKRKLKARILNKLNYWLPKGKIENLYFSKLVIS